MGWHIRGCVSPCVIQQLQSDTTIIYRDTGTHTHEHVPVPYRVEAFNSLYDTVFMLKKIESFDTSAMPADYLSARHYSDTFGDSTYIIQLTESVSQNRITSRTLLYRYTGPTAIIHNYPKPEKWSLYAGAYYTTSPGISASVTFKGWQYEAGIDLNKRPMVGVKRKIF